MTPPFRAFLLGLLAVLLFAAGVDSCEAQELKKSPPTLLIEGAGDREIPFHLREGDAECVVPHRGKLTIQYRAEGKKRVRVIGLYVWCPANDNREDT